MKNLFLFLIAGSIGICSGIAVDWQLNAGSACKGYTYYMFTGNNFNAVNSALGETYNSNEDLKSALLDLIAYDYVWNKPLTGTLNTRGVGSGAELVLDSSLTIFGVVINAASDAIANNTGWIMTDLVDVQASGMAYDDTIQPKPLPPGTQVIKQTADNPFPYKGTLKIVDVPEPSSALLLFLGLASLGLKRKQA